MNKLIEAWARNQVAANVLMIMIIIGGIWGYLNIEKEVFPNASIKGANINVSWLGASPREVEEQIIVKLEEVLSTIDNIDFIQSTARENFAQVMVIAKDNVDNAAFVNEVKSKIDGISTLPISAFPPIISEIKYNEPAQYLALVSDGDEIEMNKVARDLRKELANIPGGSPLVDLWGAKSREVSIEISEENLRSYGLTFDDISRAVRGTSINLSAGKLRTDSGLVPLTARNLADTEQAFNNIIVKQLPDGGLIKLGDVANVTDGFDDRQIRRELNGKRSIVLLVRSPEVNNIPKISKAVTNWVNDVNTRLPEGYEVIVWWDTIEMYNGRMQLVGSNAIIGLILVLITLMLFLHPKVAFWVAIGIAVSFTGTFFVLPFVGVSLNMLSLFAFLLVIGVVVDDAIIVGENIAQKVEDGETGVNAAIVGTQLVAKPVLYAVITTMIAFMPWLLIGGNVSNYTKHITLTIVFALMFSLIESFFILPSHLTNLKKHKATKFNKWLNYVSHNLYKPLIIKALKHRYITFLVFWFSFFLSIALLATGWIQFSFMPKVENSYFEISVKMPEGTAKARLDNVYDQVRNGAYIARAELENEDGKRIIDVASIRMNDNEIDASFSIIGSEEREMRTKEIAKYIRDKIGEIPDAKEVVDKTEFNGGAGFTVGLESESTEDILAASKEVEAFLATMPGMYDIRNSMEAKNQELRVTLKPGAERYGVTLSEVIRQLRQAYYGEEVQRLPRDGEDVRVMVKYPERARTSLDSMRDFRVRSFDGREIPLSAVADLTFAPSVNKIERRDRKKTVMVMADLRENADRKYIFAQLYTKFIPSIKSKYPSVNFENRGEQEDQQEFIMEFLALYGIALIVMYAVLSIAFGSYTQPLLIMSAIPFAFMGAMFGHLIFGIEMALFSFFGIGAAAGVVVNDNLVLIDYLNRLRAEGVGAIEALVRSGLERFRPILLTSVTTFVGLLPIMFEQSFDARFLMPTVVSLAFGVFFATFVTLIFVPCMYAISVDLFRSLKKLWTNQQQPKLGSSFEEYNI